MLVVIRSHENVTEEALKDCKKLVIQDYPGVECDFEDILDWCYDSLRELTISGCHLNSYDTYRLIYRGCLDPMRYLKKVDFTNCAGITGEVISRLCENNRQLVILLGSGAE